MDCGEAIEHLSRSGAGETFPELEEHLARCPTCAGRLRSLCLLDEELRIDVPTTFVEDVRARLQSPVRRPAVAYRAWAVAASLLVGIGAAALLWNPVDEERGGSLERRGNQSMDPEPSAPAFATLQGSDGGTGESRASSVGTAATSAPGELLREEATLRTHVIVPPGQREALLSWYRRRRTSIPYQARPPQSAHTLEIEAIRVPLLAIPPIEIQAITVDQ